jgi:HEAT repeat protein
MSMRRRFSLALLFVTCVLWVLPERVLADRVGQAYRGPLEEIGGHGGGGDDDDDGGGEEGGGEEGGGEEGGGGGGEEGGGGLGGGGDTGARGGGGKKAVHDGRRLWNWWWEYNKERFLARATEAGKIKSGSIGYWFGHGAKFPPREIDPVSPKLRDTKIFPALQKMLKDNDIAVRTEACIAIGRLGVVPATEGQTSERESNNLVVRALVNVLDKEKGNSKDTRELRYSAILGLGICGDKDAAKYLMDTFGGAPDEERAYRFIALGLARHLPAIPYLVKHLPRNNRLKPKEFNLAAIHAIGLMGSAAVPELQKPGVDGIKRLKKLANPRGSRDATIVQAVATLGRIQQGFKEVGRAFSSRSKDVQYTAVLAMPNYYTDPKEAADAAKFLMTKAFKAGEGQIKNFSIFAAGDLANRLDPNSKTRKRLIAHLLDVVDSNDTYLKACAAVACGVAGDRSAIPALADMMRKKSSDTHVRGAGCIALGLLHDTEMTPKLVRLTMIESRWEPDGRGYAALGLALMGDTTKIDELIKFHATGKLPISGQRHVPLAIGVLGDKNAVKTLTAIFSTPWKKHEIHMISNAVFGLSWIRDQSAVAALVELTGNTNSEVRGMAVIALGYLGARDRVNPLSRCYENLSHNNDFRWEILHDIALIL